jgi:hypothetical protein
MAYEQKPNTFSLFRDTEDRIAERKKFYADKGWDTDGVPIYSGKMTLEGGEELNIEARIIEGQKGKFFAGRVWKKKLVTEPQSNGYPRAAAAPVADDLDDDVPF